MSGVTMTQGAAQQRIDFAEIRYTFFPFYPWEQRNRTLFDAGCTRARKEQALLRIKEGLLHTIPRQPKTRAKRAHTGYIPEKTQS